MWKILSVALGGAVGALMRYLVAYIQVNYLPARFPWATFLVNILGAFFIGLFWGVIDKFDLSQNTKLFVMVGLIGSLTTFSTLSLETVKLFQDGHFALSFSYIFISNILGLLAVLTGFWTFSKFV